MRTLFLLSRAGYVAISALSRDGPAGFQTIERERRRSRHVHRPLPEQLARGEELATTHRPAAISSVRFPSRRRQIAGNHTSMTAGLVRLPECPPREGRRLWQSAEKRPATRLESRTGFSTKRPCGFKQLHALMGGTRCGFQLPGPPAFGVCFDWRRSVNTRCGTFAVPPAYSRK